LINSFTALHEANIAPMSAAITRVVTKSSMLYLILFQLHFNSCKKMSLSTKDVKDIKTMPAATKDDLGSNSDEYKGSFCVFYETKDICNIFVEICTGQIPDMKSSMPFLSKVGPLKNHGVCESIEIYFHSSMLPTVRTMLMSWHLEEGEY
jgi:hypothetical protein